MWNLNDYEDVNARIERFKQTFPNGSINSVETYQDPVNGFYTIRTEVRKDASTTWADGTDIAHGNKSEYPKHLAKFYVEDTTTSSQGRALGLVLPSLAPGAKKPTKQDMEKVIQIENPADPWVIVEKPMSTKLTGEELVELLVENHGGEVIPQCVHGSMELKEGEKNGKPWRGYVCAGKKKVLDGTPITECPPKWMHLSKTTGKWVFNS